MYPVELTGARIRLIEWRAIDAGTLWRAAAAEDVFWKPGTHATIEKTRAWLDRIDGEARADPRFLHRFAMVLHDGTLIGGARLDIEEGAQGVTSIGYGLISHQRRKGHATEAAELLIGFGFQTLNCHRIEALVEPANEGSNGVMRRLGMRQEGLLLERLDTIEGWRDAFLYALLDREWTNKAGSSHITPNPGE